MNGLPVTLVLGLCTGFVTGARQFSGVCVHLYTFYSLPSFTHSLLFLLGQQKINAYRLLFSFPSYEFVTLKAIFVLMLYSISVISEIQSVSCRQFWEKEIYFESDQNVRRLISFPSLISMSFIVIEQQFDDYSFPVWWLLPRLQVLFRDCLFVFHDFLPNFLFLSVLMLQWLTVVFTGCCAHTPVCGVCIPLVVMPCSCWGLLS